MNLAGDRVLTVRTTIDIRLQKAAEDAIEDMLRQYGDDYRVKQAAMVAVEPDGAVRAMVGGRDYGESQFNRATDALRQPGSSFKPFVYATAMMNGFTPKIDRPRRSRSASATGARRTTPAAMPARSR